MNVPMENKRLLPYTAAKQFGLQTRDYREFICGWGAAVINVCITFPINKVMFRQQLYDISSLRALEQLQKEGLQLLYRGMVSPLLQKTTTMSIMFGTYYQCQRSIYEQFPSLWLPVNKAAAAMIAGTTEAILTPLERVQVLMQGKNSEKMFHNTIHAFRELKPYGFCEYYRGLSAVLLRNGPSNIPFFIGRDYLKEYFPSTDSGPRRLVRDFICGAFLGAVISTVFYPVNVVKVRMQSNLGGEFVGFIATFQIIMEERNYNLRKLFRGVHLNYTRAFISWGITNAAYELLLEFIFNGNHKKDL